jgi:L-amino acid N-acyltransferase YncA
MSQAIFDYTLTWSLNRHSTRHKVQTDKISSVTVEQPVIIRPSCDADIERMLEIYRWHIRRGIEEGIDDSGMPQPDDLRERRKNLRNRRLPHLAATQGDAIVGYAYVVLFRKRPAYRYTVKHSIYVHQAYLGRGIGKLLMQGLIDACAAAGFRQMIGYIDADGAASLGLHEKLGFTRVGLLPGVAYRYGRWADTVMVQRSLGAGPTAPPPRGSL